MSSEKSSYVFSVANTRRLVPKAAGVLSAAAERRDRPNMALLTA